MGIETEFGCLVLDEAMTAKRAVEQIKNSAFMDLKVGAIDLHARDEVFEPARSGGFLINGGRLYIDAVGDHLEYATAECLNLKDLISHDRAGHRIITQAIREAGLTDVVRIYNNSVDHYGGHTFGCHENYLAIMDDEFYGLRLAPFMSFLVTRQIFAGAGRVGGHKIGGLGHHPTMEEVRANPIDYIWVSNVYDVDPDPTVKFQLSQRADHILKTVANRVRFNRAMINPKWEHYYSHEEMQRLHLLFGESNQSEYAFALKVGTTNLVLRLLEEDLLPEDFMLAHPVWTLKEISRDESYEWPVLMASGDVVRATHLQRRYLGLAQKYRGESEETDWVLNEWSSTLDALDSDPMSLATKLDWVAKKAMIDQFVDSGEAAWGDDVLFSLDLEYHNIDPEQSLFHALPMERFVSDLDIIDAMTDAPSDTRAFGRSKLVQKVISQRGLKFYAFDWSGAVLGRHEYVDLSDPFDPYAELAT